MYTLTRQDLLSPLTAMVAYLLHWLHWQNSYFLKYLLQLSLKKFWKNFIYSNASKKDLRSEIHAFFFIWV